MSESSKTFVGYVDGASCNTQNISSVAWAIFASNDELVSFQEIFIGISMNNISEYSALIKLLSDAISLCIRHIIISLDSQLVVLQLTSVYTVWNPEIHHMFLRFHLLEIPFDHIQYQRISRNFNSLTNSLANYVLNRHLQHI